MIIGRKTLVYTHERLMPRAPCDPVDDSMTSAMGELSLPTWQGLMIGFFRI